MHYVGLDVHRKSISYCVKRADGTIVREGSIPARRDALSAWAAALPQPWTGALEATIFTEWIYDHLQPYAAGLQVGHPARMKAIAAGKKKSDCLDARTIANLLRCDMLPPSYVMPLELRRLRSVLRYRNLLVRASVQMHNKTAGLLMELGIPYETTRLSGRKYFRQLLETCEEEIPASARSLLEFSRLHADELRRMERSLIQGLAQNPDIAERVARLTAIPGVGSVLALTWALEVGPVERLGSIDKAISFCGLCSALRESAGQQKRGPLSKQRNAHLQTALVEAAHLAPRWNPALAAVRDKELARGNRNRAPLAVARKLVAWLMAADRGHQPRTAAA